MGKENGAGERRQLIPHVRFQVISGAVPKMGQRKWFFFCSFTKRCMRSQNGTARRSHFWDRVWVHFLKFVVSRLPEAQRFGFNEALGLWRPEGQLGRPF